MRNFVFKLARRANTVAVAALLAASALTPQARADVSLLLAEGAPDCYAIGQQVAAQQGGTLARASAETQGDATVCRIVVLVPGKEGERPRRAELVLPAR